jgi:hypothetical protein
VAIALSRHATLSGPRVGLELSILAVDHEGHFRNFCELWLSFTLDEISLRVRTRRGRSAAKTMPRITPSDSPQ